MSDLARQGRAASHIMYALYAISLVTALPMILGVIVAYFARGDAQLLYRSHLSYGISAFWMSILGVVIALVFSILTVGLLSWLFFGIVWLYVLWKTVRGWMRLLDERPAPGVD